MTLPTDKTEYTNVQDSGARRRFDTGSQRDRSHGKGRFDLLPPHCVARVARHYENGSDKYGDHNWVLGQPSSVFVDSLLRHAFRYLAGDRDEDHLSAIVFNAWGVMHNEIMTGRGSEHFAALHDMLDSADPDAMVADVRRRMGLDDNAGGKPSVYLVAKMRGVDDFNYAAFDTASVVWADAGWHVISPADLNRKRGVTLEQLQAMNAGEMMAFVKSATAEDLKLLLESDAVGVHPSWVDSTNGRIEVEVALAHEIPIHDARTMERISDEQVRDMMNRATAAVTTGD